MCISKCAIGKGVIAQFANWTALYLFNTPSVFNDMNTSNVYLHIQTTFTVCMVKMALDDDNKITCV